MKTINLVALLTVITIAGIFIWHFISQKKK